MSIEQLGESLLAQAKSRRKKGEKRAKIFTRLGKELSVAVKQGIDPEANPRLRAAIAACKAANMPKDNITRSISKSEISGDKNYENLRYEGFGPFNVALIIETLTDNKNRSASSIRTVLQKSGGRLGESGSTAHLFYNCGVIPVSYTHLTLPTKA